MHRNDMLDIISSCCEQSACDPAAYYIMEIVQKHSEDLIIEPRAAVVWGCDSSRYVVVIGNRMHELVPDVGVAHELM